MPFPDIEAKFPDGHAAMVQWIELNRVELTSDIDGKNYKVYLEFMVQKDGRISNVLFLIGAEPKLDKEAIRLVNAMPNWEPATFKGERCVSKVQIPILFKN